MYFGTEAYGLESHIENDGSGTCMYRGENFGQPRTLGPGDVLANGLEIAGKWSEAGNGGVKLCFTDGTERTVASRIPLLLASGTSGKYPLDLEVGDIFETGCVVLAPPRGFNSKDSQFEDNRREVEVSITGGLSGHEVGVPKDLLIALHGEVYPPSVGTRFGAFVIDNVLKMGARARKNLPQYGRLDNQSEADRIVEVFDRISALRSEAQSQETGNEVIVDMLKEQCEQLKGVELLITGRLYGRDGTRIDHDDPRALVEDMRVEVFSARVNDDVGQGSSLAKKQPFIEFYGQTVEGNETVSARLGVGEFGVTVVDPNAQGE